MIFKKLLIKFRIVLAIIYAIILVKILSFKDVLMALEKSDKKYLNFLISNEINCMHIFNKIFKFIKIESCLIKSVSIFLFLKKNNFKPKLFIGVLIKNSEFKSHAWLMMGNKILTEKPENFVNYKIIKTVQ